VSQISPPVRIVAVVAVAFLAIYMVALRPKSSTPAPAPAAATPAGNVNTGKPAVTTFGKAVQKAQGAATATENQLKREARNAGAPADSAKSGSAPATHSAASSSPSATAAAAAPAVDVTGLPRPLAKAVQQHKVVALLFWNGRSADDHAVRAAFRHVERFHGAVYTQVAPLKRIARYGPITRGADVQQSPTVVVVDRTLKANTLVGYVDAETINQAVVDALRASGGIFADVYLKRVNKMCSATAHDLYATPQPTTIPQARRDVRTLSRRWDAFLADFRGLEAPAKWRSFKAATVTDLRQVVASNQRVMHGLGSGASVASVLQLVRTENGAVSPAAKRFNHRMDRQGLIFCGSQN
jgi:hypothetical protein